MDSLETIRKHIERTVTHIASEHQTFDDVVWEQMLLASLKHSEATAVKVC